MTARRTRRRGSARDGLCVAAVLAATVPARAEGHDVRVRADEVEVDLSMRRVELAGHVEVVSPPFRLFSDRLRLTRDALGGALVEGGGTLAFCPCLGTPLSASFTTASVDPPGDLFVKSPVLRVFGVPLFWLPLFWLRTASRPGLLPPIVQLRGGDGMLLGGGVHLPWGKDGAGGALELRAAGYTTGGLLAEATMTTPSSRTRVRVDHLPSSPAGSTGLLVDARGALTRAAPAVLETTAWDVDVLRGARGRHATTELDVAARARDRAAVETSLRSSGLTAALAFRGVAARAGESLGLDATAPLAVLRGAGALGGAGAWDVTVDGGAWGAAGATRAFVRLDAGAEAGARLGPVGTRALVRVGADAAHAPERGGSDLAFATRAAAGVPLARGFGGGPDPWRHRLEPAIEVGAIARRGDGVLGAPPGRGAAIVQGEAAVATATLRTAFGRFARKDGLEAVVSAGGVLSGETRAALRFRVAGTLPWLGLAAEGAHVAGAGHALALRARIGSEDGLALRGWLEGRGGADPIAARALAEPATEVSSRFFASDGWSAGARLFIPWGRHVVTSGGADADASRPELLYATGTLELRDGCGCLVLRATGAHRLGREGVDVWVTVDLAPR